MWVFLSFGAFGDVCQDWFVRHNVKQGPRCDLICNSLATDLKTANCHSHCEKLCEPSKDSGLSRAEKAMDLANNRLGMIQTNSEKAKGRVATPDQILSEFNQALLNKELVVLRPQPANRKKSEK